MDKDSAKAVIEAALFSCGDPVEKVRLEAMLETDPATLEDLLSELEKDYNRKRRGIRLIRLDDKVQLVTKPECYPSLIKLLKTPGKQVLSDALLETLSVVAYRQPVTRLEVEHVRGVNSDKAIAKLVEFNLVQEVGRRNDAPGRPLLFGTTDEFLRAFGVSSTEDLPVPEAGQIAVFREEAEQEADSELREGNTTVGI
ncbi:MAG: SMC-Scp complex subunit ScpB [Lachnospiraceae bacterium]|nr:SMC-Scp complex subunit ScpB [Lachnospiraceae bacterium]